MRYESDNNLMMYNGFNRIEISNLHYKNNNNSHLQINNNAW